MLFHGSARMQIVGGVEVERADGLVDRTGRKRRLGLAGADRRRTDAEIHQPDVAQVFAARLCGSRKPDQRIVAMAARQLGETDTRVGGRGWKADSAEHVIGTRRRLEQAFEEVGGLLGALAVRPGDVELALQCHETRRQFGGGIRVGERAADGAAVADRRMRDVRHRERDQRGVSGDFRGMLQRGVARERPDLDSAVFHADVVEADAIDVDQQRRVRQPHVQRGDQALAAREQLRVARMRRKLRDRVLRRACFRIGEWRWLQGSSPADRLSAWTQLSQIGFGRASHSSRPAISACQGATRCSTQPIREFSPIASTIRTTIGTNMVAVSKLLAELMMIAPSPEMVVKNSAITIATTARPTASRMPAMMYGKVAGSTMRRRITEFGATNARPTSIRLFGTAVTPSQVLMQIGNSDIRNTTAAFTAKPRPSQRISSGTSATSGIA